jgi:hypothetical protein
MSSVPRHFTDLSAMQPEILRAILDDAAQRKASLKAGQRSRPFEGKVLAMIFDKPSTRTRVSFDVAMRQLGGETIMLTGTEMQLGRSETIADTARVLSRYVDAIMIRTTSHGRLMELAENATVPVINGLTDDTHPCQIMADVLTFEEHRGNVRDRLFAWSGDGNNVLHSLIEASAQFGFRLNIAHPEGSEPQQRYVDWARARRSRRLRRVCGGGGGRRRLRGHRHLGLDGPGTPRARPQRLHALSGQFRAHGACTSGRAFHALPARPSRRGGHGRGDRRAAFGGLRRGREQAARAEGGACLVPRGSLSA